MNERRGPDAGNNSSPYDASVLWHVGSAECPVSESAAGELIKERLGTRSVGGLTSYAQKFRDNLRRESFVAEANEIPKQERLTPSRTCRMLHPGLCPASLGNSFRRMLAAANCFQKWLLSDVVEGSVVRLTGARASGDVAVVFVLAYSRKANPAVAVTVLLERAQDDIYKFVVGATGHIHEQQCPSLLAIASGEQKTNNMLL